MRAIGVTRLAAVLLLGLAVSLQFGCRDDTAAREAEEAKRRLALEEEARRSAEDARKAAEKRYEDLRREKAQSNGIHAIKEKQAEGKISTLTILSISSVLGLTLVIFLLARERSLRRIVGAALMWVLGKEGGHGP